MSRRGTLHELRLLLGHDLRRGRAAVTRPRPGVWISALLPLLLVAAALGAAGPAALPDPEQPGGAVGLGFLAAAPLAFFSYGVLFRPGDDPFLRRLGLGARALYAARALRLLCLALGVVALLALPFALGGVPLARPLAILVAAAVAAWGAALLSLATAADLTVRPGGRSGFFSSLMGMDRELVRVGPLVYAPLAPLAVGLLAAGWLGAAPAAAPGRFALAALLGVAMAALGARPFGRALPRFAPRALEMAFAPPPTAGEAGLVLDRGLARLLPARARAVWARDGAVTRRRFRWASTIVWPVAVVTVVALTRWGELPQVRAWVLAGGALTLVVQGAALIGLGRLERAGPRWIDHAAGLSPGVRWLGRWACGFGLALWLVVPLGLAWGLWAAAGAGWWWVAGGAGSSAVAAGASLAAAGR